MPIHTSCLQPTVTFLCVLQYACQKKDEEKIFKFLSCLNLIQYRKNSGYWVVPAPWIPHFAFLCLNLPPSSTSPISSLSNLIFSCIILSFWGWNCTGCILALAFFTQHNSSKLLLGNLSIVFFSFFYYWVVFCMYHSLFNHSPGQCVVMSHWGFTSYIAMYECSSFSVIFDSIYCC